MLRGFPPVVGNDTHTLILGSFPGEALFPAGDWMSPEKRDSLRQELRAVGFEDARIAEYEARFPEKPDRSMRFFVAHLRSGIVRTVHHGRVLEYDSTRAERTRAALRGVVVSEAVA